MTITEPTNDPWANPTKDCDLIMKGGITSGVIYPRAASHLATTYRFRQVGGASAGAIAAAFVAAAEYGRSHPSQPAAAASAPKADSAGAGTNGKEQQARQPLPRGFAGLEKMADELGTNLSTLFQPTKPTRAAFGILTTWIEPGWGTPRKIATTVWRLLRHTPIVAIVAFLLSMAPGVAVAAALQHGADFPHWWTPRRSWLVWVPGSLLLAVIAAAVAALVKTQKSMTENGFGLCNGHIGTDPDHQPLTDWMSDRLNEIAGLTTAHGPLTFGDLWGNKPTEQPAKQPAADAADHVADDPDDDAAGRDIDFQVMTTCLTLRRPFRFPFSSNVFFACKSCMTTYFPPSVVTAMFTEVGNDGKRVDRVTADWDCPLHPGEKVYHLPPAAEMPVVVAARISLSFPGLISAIPLCYLDHSPSNGTPRSVVAWFSDGGISSNFPMHFFDTLWPTRPTFGINLQPIDPDHPEKVWRATTPRQGLLPRVHTVDSLVGFVSSILDTMQNWNDTTQLSLPGFRDRVVEVRTTKKEGGMNLKMSPDTIADLAERGARAATLLDTFDFELHRWIRYRVALNLLDHTLTTMHERYENSDEVPEGYKDFVAGYKVTEGSYKMGVQAHANDVMATQQLMALAAKWAEDGHPAREPAVPSPHPSLRLVPPQ